MNIISVTDITKTYTERKLFEKASFYLQEREKVGVIGINGTGKSTLLKIAAGIEEPDEGQVIRANHIVVRYLPQNPVFDPELSVIDTVLAQSSQNFVGGTSEQNQNAGNHAEHVEHWNLESDIAKNIAINPIPAMPIPTNCRYLGFATKINITPIPRMIIAVLRLFVPTKPTIGRRAAIILIINQILSVLPFPRSTIQAKNKMTATLANSEG